MKKFISSKLGRLAVAGVVAAGAVVGISVAANAAGGTGCATLTYPLCARSVAKAQVVDGSLDGQEIKDGGLTASDIAPADRDAFLKDTDVKGATAIYPFDAKVVEHIGGSFKTNKTKLGEFDLPVGTWKIDMSYFAARTVAGAPGTRMQLALRVGASDTEFGADYGTVLGQEISPTANRELTGSGFKWVKTSVPVTIEVFAFGYNDDASAAGSGQITMAAQVVTTRG